MIFKSQNTQDFMGKNFSIFKVGETNILDTDISKSFLFQEMKFLFLIVSLLLFGSNTKKILKGMTPEEIILKLKKK